MILTNVVRTVKTVSKNGNSNPIWLFIFFGLLILFFIVIIVVIGIEERKDDEQFWLKYKDEKYQLLYLTAKQTFKYYSLNRFKNWVIIVCAIVACFIGFYSFLTNISIISCIFGSVSEFISVTFFWIYKQCQKEEKYYSEKLFKIKNVLIAISLNDNCKSKNKEINYDKIISSLIDESLR